MRHGNQPDPLPDNFGFSEAFYLGHQASTDERHSWQDLRRLNRPDPDMGTDCHSMYFNVARAIGVFQQDHGRLPTWAPRWMHARASWETDCRGIT